jgi:hypothetical protein
MYPVRVPAEDLSMLAVEKPNAAHDRNPTHSFQSIDQRRRTTTVENSLRNNSRSNTSQYSFKTGKSNQLTLQAGGAVWFTAKIPADIKKGKAVPL